MNTFISWFIHPDLRSAAPDELRRARLMVVFCFAMAINSAPNVVVLFSGGVWTVGSNVLACTLICVAVPFLLRVTGSLRLSAHLLLAIGCLNILISAMFSGGLSSPGMPWWGAYLIFGVMLLGTKVGLLWTTVAVVQCIAYLVLDKNGISIRNDVRHLDPVEALMSSYATAFIAYYLLARVYENLKNSMLSEIGLAKSLAERAHQSARLVLDNVAQGLLIADLSGQIEGERSEALMRWFGPISIGESIFSYLGRIDPNFSDWLKMSWEAIAEGFLPLELLIAQLPKKFTYRDRHYSVTYRPIGSGSKVTSVLVVVTDVTDIVVAERADEEQRELLAVLQRAMSDRRVLIDFFEESRNRIEALCKRELEQTIALRELHTLKGNCGLFGLVRTSRLCHELEDRLIQESRTLSEDERTLLREHWQGVKQRVLPLLGDTDATIQLSMSEYDDALRAVVENEPYPILQSRIRGWVHEPTHRRLSIFAEQITLLATRLGKGELTVRIDDGGVRLPRECLSNFWANFAHVVRNAVDHGIETKDERLSSGKCGGGTIELTTRLERGVVIIEISDDGRGIDWSRIADRAKAKGLPVQTREDLQKALFVDGISTSSEVTDISGRGVGLSAVNSAVLALGGKVNVESAIGHGSKFSFHFNLSRLRPSYCPEAIAS